jgi:hypothetical protein
MTQNGYIDSINAGGLPGRQKILTYPKGGCVGVVHFDTDLVGL